MKKNYLLFLFSILLICIFVGAQCTSGDDENTNVNENTNTNENENENTNDNEIEISDEEKEDSINPYDIFVGNWVLYVPGEGDNGEPYDIWLDIDVNESLLQNDGTYLGLLDTDKIYIFAPTLPENFRLHELDPGADNTIMHGTYTLSGNNINIIGDNDAEFNGKFTSLTTASGNYINANGINGNWHAWKGTGYLEENLKWLVENTDIYNEIDELEEIILEGDLDAIVIEDEVEEDGIVVEDAVE